MAAEISGAPRPGRAGDSRFNEAAANGRGNLPKERVTTDLHGRFNEAAANGRGNRRGVGVEPGAANALQ